MKQPLQKQGHRVNNDTPPAQLNRELRLPEIKLLIECVPSCKIRFLVVEILR